MAPLPPTRAAEECPGGAPGPAPGGARVAAAAPAALDAPAARRARRRALLHAALGGFGLAALAALIRHVGAAEMLAAVTRAAPLLPFLVALEAARVGCEALATGVLCAPRRVPAAELLRIHVVTYPVMALMPAGRAAGEAVKAALLSPHVGAPRAAAIATANQSLALLSAAPLSLLAAAALFRIGGGASPLALGVLAHAALLVASGLGVALAARQRAASAWITRRFARAGQLTAAFQEAVRERPPVPAWPFAACVVSRALQAAQYAVLLAAVGAESGPVRALAAYGVGAAGTAAGDLIPGQIGATDGAFTLAAPLLGLTASSAIAVSLLVHLLQAAFALAGIAATLAWRRSPPAR
ncbi:lysylphosphatidylglycerol synthase domain-containing protein [Sorangium sp. So ce134]